MLIDPVAIDTTHVVGGGSEVERFIPQRFEVRQIDAIVLEDHEKVLCVGYKDVRPDEFWVRAYCPELGVMPSVLICEAAAQVSSYCATKFDLLGSALVGLGGMEDVQFHGSVYPGDRLLVAAQLVKVRRGAIIVCRFECYVGDRLIAEGTIRGVALPALSAGR